MSKIRGIKVTPAQAEVHTILKERGPLPDNVLVPIVQHLGARHQTSSGIRTRRRELQDLGLVHRVGESNTGNGRKAAVYFTRKRP